MRSTFRQQYHLLTLIVVALAFLAAVFVVPAPAAAPPAGPTSAPAIVILPTDALTPPTVQPTTTRAPEPSAIPQPSQPISPPPDTRVPPTASATPVAAPQMRVGIQAGHWRAAELPSEQTHLHISAGTSAGTGNMARQTPGTFSRKNHSSGSA